MDKLRRNHFTIITIVFLVFCLFPTVAHAKKTKSKIRDFVQDVTGVTLVKRVANLPDEIMSSMFDGFADTMMNNFFFPLSFVGQAANLAREDHDGYMRRMAFGLERTYMSENEIQIGVCQKSDFYSILSPPCLSNPIEVDSIDSSGIEIIQTRIGTDGKNLFVYFKFRNTFDEMQLLSGTPIGIGMQTIEENDSRLLLFCKGCKNYTPTYSHDDIYSLNARIQIKDNEALIIAPYKALDLAPGKSFSLSGIIEFFSTNSMGARYAVLKPGFFLKTKIPA